MIAQPNMAIYLLEREHEDPRYEGFVASEDDDTPLLPARGHGQLFTDRTRDFFPDRPVGPNWVVPRLSSIWRPWKMEGLVRPFNDNPMYWPIPAFSRRAVDALRSFLEPNCEILPVIHPAGEYYMINVLTVADIVDHDKSTVFFRQPVPPEVMCDYDYYHIDPDKVSGLSIFRMRNNWIQTHVTSEFVRTARAAGLRGFVFDKIWPWPVGTRWKTEVRRERRAAEARGESTEPDSLTATAQSLVIRFKTGSRRKPSKEQRERVSTMMDSLDALLMEAGSTIAEGYVGSLEGDEVVAGEHRVFFSCPSSERLLVTLRLWLCQQDWPHEVSVIVRRGAIHDELADAAEVFPPW